MSAKYYAVVDAFFDFLKKFMERVDQTFVVIRTTSGVLIDSLGNSHYAISHKLDVHPGDNDAVINATAIFRIDRDIAVSRLTINMYMQYNSPWLCFYSITAPLIDAYISGLTLRPGFYAFAVKIYVKSGEYVQQ